MDRKEYESVIRRIEQKIAAAEPAEAEYYRGYLRGIRVHFQKSLEGASKGRARSSNAPPFHLDAPLDPYPRGYRDGCMGVKPEESS